MKRRIVALGMGILTVGMALNVSAEPIPQSAPVDNVWCVKSEEFDSQEKRVYEWIREDFGNIRICGTDNLPKRNRNGLTVVERTVGICLDDEGNGMILDTKDREYDYISYRDTGIKKGTVVVTYCVHDPESKEICDEILDRYDIGIE